MGNKLALTVRWLKPEYKVEFPPDLQPPLHMPIVSGPVKSKKVKKSTKKSKEPTECDDNDELLNCNICDKSVNVSERLLCLFPKCQAASHILCLAERFTRVSGGIIPVQGTCPTCHNEELWGDLIRKKRGCYEELSEDEDDF